MTHLLTIILLASLLKAAASTPTGQSVFATDDGNFRFGLTIANDTTSNIYLSLSGSTANTWTAVGLGSDHMDGALVLAAYRSADGSAMTLSPRFSTGRNEPSYSPDIRAEVLPGSGVTDNGARFVLNVRCGNCRAWKNVTLDTGSTAAKFILGVGPAGDMRSDDPAAGLLYHAEYGSFTMDLVRATGPAQVPDLSVVGGASQLTLAKGQSDIVTPMHGYAVLAAVLGLFPLGIIILRIFNMPRVYWVFQWFSVIICLLGIALGPYASTYYNKTRDMKTGHQVLGLIVTFIILVEAVVGCFDWPRYRRNQKMNVNSKGILKWTVVVLGWLILLLGSINGFLGFVLASYPDRNKILGGVFVAVIVILLGSLGFNHYRHSLRL